MVVSVSMEKRKAEMKPLTLLTHGVHVSSSRWSRSPLGKKRSVRDGKGEGVKVGVKRQK